MRQVASLNYLVFTISYIISEVLDLKGMAFHKAFRN
jgi:hypothetical protein